MFFFFNLFKGSVASTTTSIRKEKPQKKAIEEKRNKRKKEDISVEKVDAGDFIVEVGDKLKVCYHEKKVTYEAKVIEITLQRGIPMYMVHYTGWNNRYDELIPRERIVENLTKSYKNKKGQHFDHHGEKNKENPPKPPSSAVFAADLQNSISCAELSSTSIMAAVNKAAITSASKRGRGRSESARTRSVTPSSVASNSGRIKSVSATISKHRRSIRTGARRVSITASDMSLQTESETDSDEPVKPRSTRARDTIYKPHPTSSKKLSTIANTKAVSSSAVNSQSETGDDADDDDEDGPANSLCSLASSVTSSTGSTQKGRDYDLNQIRSELKGFKGLKSPSPGVVVELNNTINTELPIIATDKIKDEKIDFDYKPTSLSSAATTTTTTTTTTITPAAQAVVVGTKALSTITTTTTSSTSSTTTTTTTTETAIPTTTTSTSSSSSSVMSSSMELLIKPELKKEKIEVESLTKSTTDISSETDSYADDDSQSSDRTTQLQNMTKKFQQKINADKQRFMGKNITSGGINKSEQNVIDQKTRIVEKILEDSMAEKRQEGLKNKPSILTLSKDDKRGIINKKDNQDNNKKHNLKMLDVEQAIDDIKATSSRYTSLTTNIQQQTAITATVTTTTTTATSTSTTAKTSSLLLLTSPSVTSATTTTTTTTTTTNTPISKYSSVIVEKPLNIGKKLDTIKSTTIMKKTMERNIIDSLQNLSTSNIGKDNLKIETPAAAASPTSSTSSISSHISTTSSRSIPDMSKLDISSPSSSSSSFKDVKITSNITANLCNIPNKPISPDIYEFKDTEPFEFEIRKPPLSASSSSSSNIISHTSTNTPSSGNLAYGVPVSARRQSYKPGTSAAAAAAAADTLSLNFVPTILGRKKRGSPFKDIASIEKLKQTKQEEKSTVITATSTNNNLVADAKLSHHVIPTIIPSISTKSTIGTPSKLSVATSGFSTTPINVPTTQQSDNTVVSSIVPMTPTTSKSSSIIVVSTSSPTIATTVAAATTTTTTTAIPTTNTNNKTNAFDVLRKSPSFNLINALNEELAQTVQETTRALTDVVMPVTPSTPPVMDITPLTKVTIMDMPTTTTTITSSSSNKVSSNTSATDIHGTSKRQSPLKTPSTPSTPKTTDNSSVMTDTVTAITTPTTTKPIVGSPFMETKKNLSNVFEMCSYDMATTSIETRDTKFGLEKAKYLLSATVSGGFDFETTLKTENKPVSIADRVLKAISQKKEEENKIKEQKPETNVTSTENSPSTSTISWPLLPSGSVKPLNLPESQHEETPVTMTAVTTTSSSSSSTTTTTTATTTTTNLEDAAELVPISFVPTLLSTSTKALNSPETTKLSLLEANAAKNVDLNETIQKLECAIQRKTCTSLKTAATAALAFNNTSVSTILTSSPATNFSEESIDSTDSERRLVIEDVTDELPRSPIIMLKQQQQQQQLTENKRENTNTPLPSMDNIAGMQLTASSPTISHMSSISCESSASVVTYDTKLNAPKTPNTVCITLPEIPASVVMTTTTAAIAGLTKLKQTPLLMTTKSETSITTITTTNINTTTNNNTTTYTNILPVNSSNILPASTIGFFLNSRTDLRPEDGVKPISDMLLHAVSAQADVERAKEVVEQAAITAHVVNIGNSVVSGTEIQHDSINLLCEETIPGSPAPVANKDELPLVTAQQQQQPPPPPQQQQQQNDGKLHSEILQTSGNLQENKIATISNVVEIKPQQLQQPQQQQLQQQHSSPNESCSQDDSSEESKKTQSEQDFGTRKRPRTRKTSERDGQSQQQQQQQQQSEGSMKRRRTMTHKKHNQGSDSDENSDSITIRTAISTRQQQMQQQFQTIQQPQMQEQSMTTGLRPCPYNFLVQLDPTLSSDQCIAILLKQIQELRKTYNNIKGDLAAIDRRRKKIRRRNREKKQNQNQQTTQLLKVSATS